jgi:hypothetical protein
MGLLFEALFFSLSLQFTLSQTSTDGGKDEAKKNAA